MSTLLAGIYIYWFKDTKIDPCEQSYIGSSINLKRRHNDHMSRLKANKHSNKHFQNIYNKYKDNMVYEIIEYVYFPETYDNIIKREFLECLEQYYYEELNCQLNKCQPAFNSKANKYNCSDTYIKNKRKRPVYLVDNSLNVVRKFNGIREASRILNINITSIANVASLKYQNTKGYVFRFEETLMVPFVAKTKIKKKLGFRLESKKCKSINCYLLDGTFVKSYQSIAIAADDLKLQTSGISRVLSREAAHSGGYFFKLQNDLSELILPQLKKRNYDLECYKDGCLYKCYKNASEASKELHLDRRKIWNAGKSGKKLRGYMFKLIYK